MSPRECDVCRVRCVCAMRVRCMRDACAMRVRCMRDACAMRVRCMCDACVMHDGGACVRWGPMCAHVRVPRGNRYRRVPALIMRHMSRGNHPHSPWLVHTELRVNGTHIYAGIMHMLLPCVRPPLPASPPASARKTGIGL